LFGEVALADAAAKMLESGANMVCVSLGARGAYFRTKNAEAFGAGFSIDVEDATGAGDAFLAGVSVWLCESGEEINALTSRNLEEMASFANACGAIAATRLGGMDAAFNRDDIARLQSDCARNA
jgi:fructokinase